MLKRLLVSILLFIGASGAQALEFTDVYYIPAESGWGFFVVQSNTFQFLAFFVFGPDGKPTWYVAGLTDDGTGKYTGQVFATTGTYFPLPWNPAQATGSAVGTATFQPTDLYHATFSYTIAGAGTVTKNVQRQTLTSYQMPGRYSGSMAGSISGCTDPTANDPAFRARYVLDVTQQGDTAASLTFTFVDQVHDGLVCTISGPLTHFGRLYQMSNVGISCTGLGVDGKTRNANVDSLHPTGQGIEGRFGANFGGGCTGSLHFAAVLNVNN